MNTLLNKLVQHWFSELHDLKQVQVSRCQQTIGKTIESVSLHTIVDASENAMEPVHLPKRDYFDKHQKFLSSRRISLSYGQTVHMYYGIYEGPVEISNHLLPTVSAKYRPAAILSNGDTYHQVESSGHCQQGKTGGGACE